jgi:TrbL/VirB6 plasmid conjugal transfer protein
VTYLFDFFDPNSWAAAFSTRLLDQLGTLVRSGIAEAVKPAVEFLQQYLLSTTDILAGGDKFTDAAAVRHFVPYSTAAADAGLVLVATWGCYHLMFAHSSRGLYSLHVLLPRLLLGIALIHLALPAMQQVIDFNNALCRTVVGATPPVVPPKTFADLGAAPILKAVTLALLGLGYLILALAYVVRFALLTVLAITAPLAALLFILPDTHHYARKWGALFVSALFMQPLQLLLLAVGMFFETENHLSSLENVFALATLWLSFKVPGALHDTSSIAGHAITHAKHLAHMALKQPAHHIAHAAAEQ